MEYGLLWIWRRTLKTFFALLKKEKHSIKIEDTIIVKQHLYNDIVAVLAKLAQTALTFFPSSTI